MVSTKALHLAGAAIDDMEEGEAGWRHQKVRCSHRLADSGQPVEVSSCDLRALAQPRKNFASALNAWVHVRLQSGGGDPTKLGCTHPFRWLPLNK